ncbi:MAG: acyloxyacyl hydrolase [Candidatus Hydrogenedentes bacterium]|nr:acyloxyacyl hydrolase [Candidatus Hydrogenedentota bacterium]
MIRSGIPALVLALIAPFAMFILAESAQADNAITQGFGEGRWRTEVGAATGFHSGRRDRTGDIVVKGSLEYEWPIFARATLGLRTYPLFLYMQDDPEDTLAGGGLGIASRVYQNKDTRDGVFVEGGASVLFHSNHIEGNDATMDFLLEGGLGYQFKSNWHVTLQVQHISNGGLSEDNAGANSVGLAVGYTF